MNQHRPPVHPLSRTFKRVSIRPQEESGVLFNRNRDLRKDIVVEKRGIRCATSSEFRNKAIPLDIEYA